MPKNKKTSEVNVEQSGFTVVENFELTPRTRKSKYPFATMSEGQGFIVAGAKSPSSVYAAAKRHGVKISTRVTAEGLEVKMVGSL